MKEDGLARFSNSRTDGDVFRAAVEFLKMLHAFALSGKDTFTRRELTSFLNPSHWEAQELRRFFMIADAKCAQLVERHYLEPNKRGLAYKILLRSEVLDKPQHSAEDYEFYPYYQLALSMSKRKPASTQHIYALVTWSNKQHYAAAMLKKAGGARDERQKGRLLARRERYLQEAARAQEEIEQYRAAGEFISTDAARNIYYQRIR